MTDMERINRIWRHPTYQECLKKIAEHEKDRKFCRHTPEHFLDVARITLLLAHEEGIGAEKEIVYAAGLLHDIGRFRQYEEGIPHEQASADLAEKILEDCVFTDKEKEEILALIRSHRRADAGSALEALFRRADKLSRNCFSCPACGACSWTDEKKNREIRI